MLESLEGLDVGMLHFADLFAQEAEGMVVAGKLEGQVVIRYDLQQLVAEGLVIAEERVVVFDDRIHMQSNVCWEDYHTDENRVQDAAARSAIMKAGE